MVHQHSLWEEARAVLAAMVGGARYGVKIRVPHALVMTVLFRRDLTASEKLRSVLRLAKEHASNLALFAAIYKSVLALFKRASRHLSNGDGDHPRSLGRILLGMIVDGPAHQSPVPLAAVGEPDRRAYHSFVAGWVGGYCVWGRYSSVNHQIVLYLASRVLVGLCKRFWEGGPSAQPDKSSSQSSSSILRHPSVYPLAAATVWGIVMALFEESPHVLHRSLKASMDEIYRYRLPKAGEDADPSPPPR